MAVSVCGHLGFGRFGLWPLWPETQYKMYLLNNNTQHTRVYSKLKNMLSVCRLTQCGWLYRSVFPVTPIRNSIITAQIARFMGPTWGSPGSSRRQMGPMLAPWILLSGWWTYDFPSAKEATLVNVDNYIISKIQIIITKYSAVQL